MPEEQKFDKCSFLSLLDAQGFRDWGLLVISLLLLHLFFLVGERPPWPFLKPRGFLFRKDDRVALQGRGKGA